jgi:hypothetical protein
LAKDAARCGAVHPKLTRVTVKECFDTDYHVIESLSPFEEVSIDYMVGLPKDVEGFENVLVVVDNFSKFVELFPVKTMDAVSTAKCLVQLFARYGHIKSIRSDRGSNFIGEVCKELLQLCGTSQVLTVGFRPQANGIVERLNAEIKRHLQVIINERNWSDRWSTALPLIQRILNGSVCSSTGFAPSVMLFGRNVDLNRGIFRSTPSTEKLVECPKYVQDLVRMQEEILNTSQENVAEHLDRRIMKKQQKKGAATKKFAEGDLVITVRDVGTKLDYKWEGPYRVVKKLFANVYELENQEESLS